MILVVIGTICGLAFALYIINVIIAMFTRLLINILKLLAPICVISNFMQYAIGYMYDNNTTTNNILLCDHITGLVIITYVTIMYRINKSRIGYRIFLIAFTIIIMMYLYNDFVEGITLRICGYSANQMILDLLYWFIINLYRTIYSTVVMHVIR